MDCDGTLNWPEVNAGATVTGDFQIGNTGEVDSLLNWSIDTYPTWGTGWTFTPSSGTELAKGSWVTIDVSVVAPNQKNTPYTDKIKIINTNNASDFCEIDVSLTTPRNKALLISQPILQWLIERFPILRHLLGL